MAACIATYELGVNRLPHDYSEVGTQLAKEAEWIEAVGILGTTAKAAACRAVGGPRVSAG